MNQTTEALSVRESLEPWNFFISGIGDENQKQYTEQWPRILHRLERISGEHEQLILK